MSSGKKIWLDSARGIVDEFLKFFGGTFVRWEVAGSVRRNRAEVGDIEHVVIPKIIDGRNVLWERLDSLVPGIGLFANPDAPLRKSIYSNGTNRWGEKYRGVDFAGVKHEIFTADEENFGCILAIRTGPAEFSKKLVTMLLHGGNFRQQDGYLVRTAGPNIGERVPCPDEKAFFQLCGHAWIDPSARR